MVAGAGRRVREYIGRLLLASCAAMSELMSCSLAGSECGLFVCVQLASPSSQAVSSPFVGWVTPARSFPRCLAAAPACPALGPGCCFLPVLLPNSAQPTSAEKPALGPQRRQGGLAPDPCAKQGEQGRPPGRKRTCACVPCDLELELAWALLNQSVLLISVK